MCSRIVLSLFIRQCVSADPLHWGPDCIFAHWPESGLAHVSLLTGCKRKGSFICLLIGIGYDLAELVSLGNLVLWCQWLMVLVQFA